MSPLYERQGLHLVLLLILLAAVFAAAQLPAMLDGAFLGLSARAWLILAVAIPVLHQVYVAFAFRGELHAQILTRWFGERGFGVHTVIFMVLFIARPLAVIGLGIANAGTLPPPYALWIGLGLVLALPAIYLFYSVAHYFGLRRALGIDHFDASYRSVPLVREGIFRYSSNAMYVYGFLILWSIALLASSRAALLAAAFNHLYIWVHYYCTEEPDMRFIYGPPAAQ